MSFDVPEYEAFLHLSSKDNSIAESRAIADEEDLSSLTHVQLVNFVQALQAEKARLQALVCDLLCKNEQLRCRNSVDEEHTDTGERKV